MVVNILFAFFSLFTGFYLLVSKDKVVLKNITVDVSSNQVSLNLIGIILILFGIYFFYRIYRAEEDEDKLEKFIESSKCPKCKEVYVFHRLDKGICPTCNVETIDVDVYFKVHKEDELST